MTTSQIHTFLAVCRCLSFTEAAASLNLTQSAVSRQISGLENELGFRLFDRNNNILRLTAAGDRVQAGFSALTHNLDTMLEEARRISQGVQGVLRIGQLADQAISRELGDAVHVLTKSGSVSITVTRLDMQRLFQMLGDGELDVVDTVVHHEEQLIGFESLVYQKKQSLYLAVRRELLGELPRRISRSQFVQLSHRVPIYMVNPPANQPAPSWLRGHDGFSDIPITYRDFDSIVLMTAAGLCATVTNRDNILAQDPGVALVELPFFSPVSRCLLWRKENRNPMIPALIAAARG